MVAEGGESMIMLFKIQTPGLENQNWKEPVVAQQPFPVFSRISGSYNNGEFMFEESC
jgi:hypothetical protein